MAVGLDHALEAQPNGRPAAPKVRFQLRRVSDFRGKVEANKKIDGTTVLNEALDVMFREHKYEFNLYTDRKWNRTDVTNGRKHTTPAARTAYWNQAWTDQDAKEERKRAKKKRKKERKKEKKNKKRKREKERLEEGGGEAGKADEVDGH